MHRVNSGLFIADNSKRVIQSMQFQLKPLQFKNLSAWAPSLLCSDVYSKGRSVMWLNPTQLSFVSFTVMISHHTSIYLNLSKWGISIHLSLSFIPCLLLLFICVHANRWVNEVTWFLLCSVLLWHIPQHTFTKYRTNRKVSDHYFTFSVNMIKAERKPQSLLNRLHTV